MISVLSRNGGGEGGVGVKGMTTVDHGSQRMATVDDGSQRVTTGDDERQRVTAGYNG